MKRLFIILLMLSSLAFIACTADTSNIDDEKDMSQNTLSIEQEFQSEIACPRGIANDPAPGICAAYIDKDGSKICDLSEQ